MMLRARSIAWASAVKIELLAGAKFLLSTGIGFCLQAFIQFEDHFRFFNDPRWC